MESVPAISIGIVAFGLLLLAGLVLAIPLLVILLVNPKSRAVLASFVRFVGWAVGCVMLLALLGYFVVGPHESAPRQPTQMANSQGPATSQTTTTALEKSSAGKGSLPVSSPANGAVNFAPAFAEVSSVRPGWIDQAPGIQGQTYCVAVKSGLWTTNGECQQAIGGAITKALDDYLTSYFNDERAAKLVDIDPAYLRQHLVKRPLYAETVDASVGTMRQWHALLEFDDDLRAELHRLWRQASVSNRLGDAAAGFGLVLAALGTLFAYLRLDLATSGQYRGRLRCASGLAILLVAAGAVGICML